MALLKISEPGGKPARTRHKLAVGIDLGTTHSLVAAPCGKTVETLPDQAGRHLLPSVVRFLADKQPPQVGYDAWDEAINDPRNTVISVKRFLGKSLEEIRKENAYLEYEFLEDQKPGVTILRTVAGNKNPIEISAEILRTLKSRAETYLKGSLDGAVITVPAYFDDSQRQQTRDAARLAGLEVLRLLNEPTAAAVAYGLDSGDEGDVVVFDLGGGTFDVSVLRLQKGVFQVLATGGDTSLGGDDFDRLLAEWILTQSESSATKEPVRGNALLTLARQIKHQLSEQDTVAVEYENFSGTIDSENFTSLAAPLVAKTIKACKRVLRDARLTPEDIKNVILVGGATRMPVIRQVVKTFFKREPLTTIDPDKVVAIGAGIQADVLAGNKPGDTFLLLDVNPLSLGIETMGELVEKIIPRNSTIPATRTQEFTTYKDGQSVMLFHVVQGERELVSDCRSLARFELRGIPPMAAGAAKIQVTFQVDADGLLSVSAVEASSGVSARVQVKPSYGLDSSEIEKMLIESREYAEKDVQLRALKEAQLEANQILAALDSALAVDGNLLDDKEQEQISVARKHLEDSLNTADNREIHRLTEKLNAATAEFAARRMDIQIAKALRGESINTASHDENR